MIEKNLEVIFNRQITSDTFLMGFMSPEIAEEARPGQFLMVRVGPGLDPFLRRPFSICGILQEKIACMLYKVVGRGTAMLAQISEGERLSVMGPLGNGFNSNGEAKKSLLIGGGIGIAPLIFLAKEMKSMDIEFMTGFGTASDIIDIDQIDHLPVSVSLATDDGTKGYSGMVTELLNEYLDQHNTAKISFSLYACGPLSMLKSVAFMSADHDLPCQTSLESVMACGLGACQGCAIKSSHQGITSYLHVCKDGPVFPAHTVDWHSL